MSTIKVANIHFDSTETNRIEYSNSNINFYSSNVTFSGNASFTGNISANYITGNGALLGGVVTDFSPAFNQANAAFDKANSANVVASSGYDKANSANVVAKAAFDAANTKVSSVSGTAGQVYSSGGTTPTVNLISTGVTAKTYGGSTTIPVITVDDYGRVTSAANVTVVSSGSAAPCIVLQGTTTGLCCYTIPTGYSKIRFYAVGAGGNGQACCGQIRTNCCCICWACSGGGGSMAYGCISVTSGSVICACFASGCTRIYYGGVQMAAAPGASGCTGGTGACICTPCVTCGGTADGGNGCWWGGGASAGSPLGTGKSSCCQAGPGAGIGASPCGIYICGSHTIYWGVGSGAGSASLYKARFMYQYCNPNYSMVVGCGIEVIGGGAGPKGGGRYQYDFTDGSCCYFTDPLLSLATSPGICSFTREYTTCGGLNCCVCGSINPYCEGPIAGPGAGGFGAWGGVGAQSCCANCVFCAGAGGLFAGGGAMVLALSTSVCCCACICLGGGNGGLFAGGGAASAIDQSSGFSYSCMVGGCGGCGGGGGIATVCTGGACPVPSYSGGCGGGPAVVYLLQ